MNVIRVESIKIQIGNREIELTPDEAGKLRDELDRVLPAKYAAPSWYPLVIRVMPTHTPTYTGPGNSYWYQGPTCGGIGSGTTTATMTAAH